MDPLPPQIFSCPHCQALYKRSSDFDENGLDHWSDGKLCIDVTVDFYLDAVVRCTNCAQLFVTDKARIQNKWGFSIPKDIKFYPANPLSIAECQTILKDENMLSAIGASYAFNWFDDSGIDPDDAQTIKLAGEISMRLAIWTKLNDLTRYENHIFTKEEKQLYKETTETLIRIIPNQIVDSELLLAKAELYRNKGRFLKSILTLRRKSVAHKFAAKRLMRLNLLLQTKLTTLNRTPFRRTSFGRKVEQLKYRIEDFFDSFRKKYKTWTKAFYQQRPLSAPIPTKLN